MREAAARDSLRGGCGFVMVSRVMLHAYISIHQRLLLLRNIRQAVNYQCRIYGVFQRVGPGDPQYNDSLSRCTEQQVLLITTESVQSKL